LLTEENRNQGGWNGCYHIDFPDNYQLKEGYTFLSVPRNAHVSELESIYARQRVRYRWNGFKILLSITQLLYSIYSLYKVTHHEIERFGYAAYGLTVASYIAMGIFNLIANLVTPEFDQLYIIKSAHFDSAVELKPEYRPKVVHQDGDHSRSRYDNPSRGRHEDPSRGRYEYSSRGRHGESSRDRYDDPSQGRYGYSSRDRYDDPSRGRHEDSSRNRHEESSRGRHRESRSRDAHPRPVSVITDFPLAGRLDEELYRDLHETNRRSQRSGGYSLAGHLVNDLEYRESHHPIANLFIRWFNLRDRPTFRPYTRPYRLRGFLVLFFSMAVVVGICSLIYYLSKLKTGQSSLAERIWTTGWLVTGLLAPFVMQLIEIVRVFFDSFDARGIVLVLRYVAYLALALALVACAFPVGGVVVVIQEMLAFGSCTALS
jgi:hypothetical protein